MEKKRLLLDLRSLSGTHVRSRLATVANPHLTAVSYQCS